MTIKYISFIEFIKVFILCVLALKTGMSLADDFVCDTSITEKVLERYQNLTKYEDKGELTTNRDGIFTFETIYSKLNELRFIFYNPPGHGAYNKLSFIKSNNEISTTFEGNRFDTQKWEEINVRSLLQSASGVTSGASLAIPPLLVGMLNVWTLESPVSMAIESNKENITFCKVFFERGSGAKETFWVRENGTIERFRRELNIPRHLVSDIKYQIIEMQ